MEAVINQADSSIDEATWATVCSLNDITPDTGVCALINGEQVAVFRERKNNNVFAISNYDPFGEANVLSRGILGSISGQLVVASPLYKQHFDLKTGQCLEDEAVSVKTFPVRVNGDSVQISTQQILHA